jgi:hypothetical protein
VEESQKHLLLNLFQVNVGVIGSLCVLHCLYLQDYYIEGTADDTVIYFAGPSPDFVLNALQQSFLSVQQAFSTLNLVLNTSKTKVMWFGKKNALFPKVLILSPRV